MSEKAIESEKADVPDVHDHNHSHDHSRLHAYIGVSLVLGFVFMLLVDQIGNSHVHTADGKPIVFLIGNQSENNSQKYSDK